MIVLEMWKIVTSYAVVVLFLMNVKSVMDQVLETTNVIVKEV